MHASTNKLRAHPSSAHLQRRTHTLLLVMVIDGIDFLWAAPTAHKSDPESLLESFPVLSDLQLLANERPRAPVGDAWRPPLQPAPAPRPFHADRLDMVIPAEEADPPP